jgi:hypothetical protein
MLPESNKQKIRDQLKGKTHDELVNIIIGLADQTLGTAGIHGINIMKEMKKKLIENKELLKDVAKGLKDISDPNSPTRNN